MPRKLFFALFLSLMLPAQVSAQERQWNLDITENEAFLVYGAPSTNDVGLGFWCLKNGPENFLFMPLRDKDLRPGQKLTAQLTLGETKAMLKGRVSLDIASGVTTFETKLKRNGELWQKIIKSDVLSLTILKHQTTLPIADADFENLDSACTQL